MLPYRLESTEELSTSFLETWKTFGKRYGEFKQILNEKKLALEQNSRAKLVVAFENKKNTIGLVSQHANKNDESLAATASSGAVDNKLINMKKIEFDDWDYKENEKFLISNERLESDIVYEVASGGVNGRTILNDNDVHYFMEQREDLFLSEDESDVRN